MRRIRNSGIVGEKIKRDNCRTVVLGYMTLERRVFDLFECPYICTRKILLDGKNAVTGGCVRGGCICPTTRN